MFIAQLSDLYLGFLGASGFFLLVLVFMCNSKWFIERTKGEWQMIQEWQREGHVSIFGLELDLLDYHRIEKHSITGRKRHIARCCGSSEWTVKSITN